MEGLQARKTALEAQLESMKQLEPLLHPGMAAVYRKKVAELVSALDSADVEERESARTEIRVLVTAIVVPEDDAKLRVEGNLGEMLAIAASGRIRSTLAAVAKSGCGGSQPTLSAALATGGVKRIATRRSAFRPSSFFLAIFALKSLSRSTDLAAVGAESLILGAGRDNRGDTRARRIAAIAESSSMVRGAELSVAGNFGSTKRRPTIRAPDGPSTSSTSTTFVSARDRTNGARSTTRPPTSRRA